MSQKKKRPVQKQPSKSTAKPVAKTPSKTAQKPVKKERGFWLGLIIVLIIVHGLIAAVAFYLWKVKPIFEVDKTWVLSLAILHFLANVVAGVAIWFWKKWGYYLYAISSLVGLFVGLITVGIWASFYMILPLAILGWVIQSKWKLFE
jgi:hypothetical protein